MPAWTDESNEKLNGKWTDTEDGNPFAPPPLHENDETEEESAIDPEAVIRANRVALGLFASAWLLLIAAFLLSGGNWHAFFWEGRLDAFVPYVLYFLATGLLCLGAWTLTGALKYNFLKRLVATVLCACPITSFVFFPILSFRAATFAVREKLARIRREHCHNTEFPP